MKHIFYFIGIAFIIHEIMWVLNPKEQTEKNKRFNEESKKNKGKKWDDFSSDYKEALKTKGVIAMISILWLFGGLLTFNWVAFVVIIAFNFIIIAPITKLLKYSWAYTVLHWLNSVIGFSFGVFVIINSYHLKIDLYEWIKSIL